MPIVTRKTKALPYDDLLMAANGRGLRRLETTVLRFPATASNYAGCSATVEADSGAIGGYVKREKSVLNQEWPGEVERTTKRHVAGAGLGEREVRAVGVGHVGRDGQFSVWVVVTQCQQRLIALRSDPPFLHKVGFDGRAVGVSGATSVWAPTFWRPV